ncbi:MAG TPA: hypothetical protein VG104_00010 [Candidatus Dormibacteraeota bacterium]|nr:hypothetical protein [Candidatus Dormibacteraeota bacterium]
MKRLLLILGFPIFLAACGAPGGLYGAAPATSSTASAPAASPSANAATPAPTPTPTATPAAPATVIASQNARLGTILTDAQGRTLYYFVPERGGKIVCSSSACTTYWPPSLGGNPTGGTGVTGQLGVIARTGGAQQITYNTWPLYTFAGDSAAGQTNGQGVVGFGGKWLVATPGLQP